eukprot:7442293-Ditylum_brightwellii.AAC.1
MQTQLEQLCTYIGSQKVTKHKTLKQKQTPYSIVTCIFKQNITCHVLPTITTVTIVAAVQAAEIVVDVVTVAVVEAAEAAEAVKAVQA